MTKTKVVQFTKTDRRILIDKLEHLYSHTQKERHFFLKHLAVGSRITNINNRDRIFRTDLKAMEIILHKLGSKIFENDKRPSIRKTFTVAAQNNGFVQN